MTPPDTSRLRGRLREAQREPESWELHCVLGQHKVPNPEQAVGAAGGMRCSPTRSRAASRGQAACPPRLPTARPARKLSRRPFPSRREGAPHSEAQRGRGTCPASLSLREAVTTPRRPRLPAHAQGLDHSALGRPRGDAPSRPPATQKGGDWHPQTGGKGAHGQGRGLREGGRPSACGQDTQSPASSGRGSVRAEGRLPQEGGPAGAAGAG